MNADHTALNRPRRAYYSLGDTKGKMAAKLVPSNKHSNTKERLFRALKWCGDHATLDGWTQVISNNMSLTIML